MRPIVKGNVPKNTDGTNLVFEEYREAKRFLIERIGEYCSYCERPIKANLAVEHVQPKSLVTDLELNWDNFLLACTNCNSTKGKKAIVLTDYFWADQDNTFFYFMYNDSGLVNVQEGLSDEESMKAENTIKLTGLDKPAPKPNTKDFKKANDLRAEHRLEAWYKANDFLEDYENTDTNVRLLLSKHLVEIVKGHGFWSIWMTVFKNHPIVIQELVNGIKGTNTTYFHKSV